MQLRQQLTTVNTHVARKLRPIAHRWSARRWNCHKYRLPYAHAVGSRTATATPLRTLPNSGGQFPPSRSHRPRAKHLPPAARAIARHPGCSAHPSQAPADRRRNQHAIDTVGDDSQLPEMLVATTGSRAAMPSSNAREVPRQPHRFQPRHTAHCYCTDTASRSSPHPPPPQETELGRYAPRHAQRPKSADQRPARIVVRAGASDDYEAGARLPRQNRWHGANQHLLAFARVIIADGEYQAGIRRHTEPRTRIPPCRTPKSLQVHPIGNATDALLRGARTEIRVLYGGTDER